jgi:outer membrane protein assembly factor BamB
LLAQAPFFSEPTMKTNDLDWPAARFVILLSVWLVTALCGAAQAAEIDPLDWPSWRGPEQNGISRETGIIDQWDPKGGGTKSNVLWQNDELGGICTPIVMRGKLYTVVRSEPGTSSEGEKVVCVDANSGKLIWESKNNVYLTDVPAERIGWASCAGDPATGRVYAIGACGYLKCLDGETGKTLWDHSLGEDYGLLTTYGGRLTTPVVFEDLVIVCGVIIGWGDTAKPTHRFLAFDKKTGICVWQNGTQPLPDDTTYSTPVTTVLDGAAAMLFGSGDGGVHAWQPRTGKPIWRFDFSLRGLNVSPVVADNRVYTGQSEENVNNPASMGSIVCIDGSKSGDITTSGEAWRLPGIMAGKSAPLLVDGRLYMCDDRAKLHIVDAATGELVGRPVRLIGTRMKGSPIWADGKIYACSETGWHVLEPTADGVKMVHKLRMAAEDEILGSPIISHGRLYLPTTSRIYCLAKPDVQPQATAGPAPPVETPAGKDDPVAQVQLVPAESLLKPGWEQKFRVRLFNARGQFLREGKAEFSLAGPGEISADGTFRAASAPAHTATIVTAKVGDVEGRSRIRVVPELPWKFDFVSGDIPLTWIGARYRHVVRDVDGRKVMVKLTTIPKGQRSQAVMGHPDLHDYTITADVLGTLKGSGGEKADKLPDVGVIAQRYTMALMGEHQKIQIRSWTSQVATRFAKDEPFAWDADTWYTLKFRAAAEDGKAVLKGKVWKRGESEPEAWTIEAVDEVPNVVGSPGLFGNAQVSELYIDNVSVSENTP